jgi:hypothetical protein
MNEIFLGERLQIVLKNGTSGCFVGKSDLSYNETMSGRLIAFGFDMAVMRMLACASSKTSSWHKPEDA